MIATDNFCHHRNATCRHCSMEGIRRKTRACDRKTGNELVINQEILFGLYCNNYCEWVAKVVHASLHRKRQPVRNAWLLRALYGPASNAARASSGW